MLVDLLHLAQVVVLMVMAGFFLHPLHGLFLQKLHTVHHPQRGPCPLRGVQNGIHPGVGLPTQVNEEVTLLYRQNVRRCRFVGMALRPRRQQQRYIRIVSPCRPGKIISRKNRGHNMQLSVILLLRALPAGRQSQYQQSAQQCGDPSLQNKSSFKFENDFQFWMIP